MSRVPRLGAWVVAGGTRFRVWAPEVRSVEVVLDGATEGAWPLDRLADGSFTGTIPGVGEGALYRYRLDGGRCLPDPASRFQPLGVHGPSQVVDAGRFPWSDDGWRGIAPEELVIYELHVGTFTPEGTFAAAAGRLEELAALGVSAIELLPVADFPGARNWGYDGVDLFAPARCYGTPDDLRALVDWAHGLGLAVLLDVVYNHLGPDGNYLAAFSRWYFAGGRRTPWGEGINLDGAHCGPVREFLIENALSWICEYHLDGFRFDATHALPDESPRHLLAELSATVREAVPGRRLHLIAEDNRNLSQIVQPEAEEGWGLDGVWADDFHHQVHRLLTGEAEGVYRDYRGSVADLAETLNRGWLFRGEYSVHRGRPQGTEPSGIDPLRLVYCLQNHDRVGNRVFGDRLHRQLDAAAYRAASALLLCAPAVPLLFMGQEWAAGAPFYFFTDHHEELGRRVREGRLREFRHYAGFSDEASLARVPDVQDAAAFVASKLDWSERDREPHASTLRLYRDLLGLRKAEPALRGGRRGYHEASAIGEDTLLLRRTDEERSPWLLVARLRGSGTVKLAEAEDGDTSSGPRWRIVLTTEDPRYCVDPSPPRCEWRGAALAIDFARPCAILLRC